MDSKALNIIHLVEPGSGGSLRHVIDLAGAQAAAGHKVAIIYSSLRLEDNYKNQLQQLHVVRLYELRIRRVPSLSDFQIYFSLLKILRTEKPDILHAHSTKAGLLARKIKIFTKAKIIYTPHAWMSMNPDMPRWQKMIYAAYEMVAAFFTDRVIVFSRHEYDHGIGLGIPATKLAMAQHGIHSLPHAERNALRDAQNIRADQPVIGFVGRMVHQKNPQLAVQTFAKIKQRIPNAVLYMIGDGPLLGTCQNLAMELGLNNSICWLGYVDARDHYAAMDILLATSRYETLPYYFLEALSAGVPIVTTDVGGSESCVIPHQTGVIAAAAPDALANAAVAILRDGPLHDAMRFAARARGEHFGIPQMLESIIAVYAEALNR